MILIDDEGAERDLRDGLRLLSGRLQGQGRRLSPGAEKILSAVSGSGRVLTDQALAGADASTDDERVPAVLTFDEVAIQLRQSRSTVKRLVDAGELSAVHIGRTVRVRPADLQAYIDSLPTGTPIREVS